MAYLPQEEEDQNPGQSVATGGSAVVPPTTGGGSGSQLGGGGSVAPMAGSTQKGTGFVNTQDYIKANEGQKFGAQVAGDVGNVAQGAVDSLGGVQQSFNDNANKGLVRPDDNILKNIAAGKARSVVNNPGQLKKYNEMAGATYKGPGELSEMEGFGDLSQKYGKARSYLNNTATEPGRQTLLGDMYAVPNYTGGMRGLDQMILQADPNSRDQLQTIRDRYADIDDDIIVASQAAQGVAEGKRAEAERIKRRVANATNSAKGSLTTTLKRNLARTNKDRDAEYATKLAAAIEDAQKNTPNALYTPEQITAAVTAASKKGKGYTSVSQAASDDDVAQYNALSTLMGNPGDTISRRGGNEVYTLGDWISRLPALDNGGQMSAPTKGPGGYVEQTRRKTENSAVGEAVKKISPTAKVKKKLGF